jgi:uncharacterized OB-fold protein
MAYNKPLPTTTVGNMKFWDGLKEHEFRVPRCRDCDAYNWIPYPACRNCLSEDLDWSPVSGTGTVWTYSVVHRGAGFHATPYVVAVAKLDLPGPRSCLVLATLIDVDPETVHIGMPVKIGYEDIPEENAAMYHLVPA